MNAMVRVHFIELNASNLGTRGKDGDPIATRSGGGLEILLREDFHNEIL